MIRSGRVVSAQDGHISVCFERPEMCEKCGACGERHESLVTFEADAQVGDRVQVELPETQLFRTAAITYLIPLAALLLGLLGGQALFQSELGCALSALGLLLASLPVVIRYDRHIRKNPLKTPRIISINQEEENA